MILIPRSEKREKIFDKEVWLDTLPLKYENIISDHVVERVNPSMSLVDRKIQDKITINVKDNDRCGLDNNQNDPSLYQELDNYSYQGDKDKDKSITKVSDN